MQPEIMNKKYLGCKTNMTGFATRNHVLYPFTQALELINTTLSLFLI